MQIVKWKAQWSSETKVVDKGESEEAAVGIESDGRRKEIADNLSLDWKVGTFFGFPC